MSTKIKRGQRKSLGQGFLYVNSQSPEFKENKILSGVRREQKGRTVNKPLLVRHGIQDLLKDVRSKPVVGRIPQKIVYGDLTITLDL